MSLTKELQTAATGQKFRRLPDITALGTISAVKFLKTFQSETNVAEPNDQQTDTYPQSRAAHIAKNKVRRWAHGAKVSPLGKV